MTLIPAAPTRLPAKDVDPALLETPVAEMVEGPYQWREYCNKHAAAILLRNPEKRHRTVSLYEILTAYREYRCAHCKRLLWNPDVKEDI
jgi:hypothetical protein